MTELSILTWNIRQGGSADRLPHILKWILHHDADIMVITEFQHKREGAMLQSALLDPTNDSKDTTASHFLRDTDTTR
jgi:hypothetical protein